MSTTIAAPVRSLAVQRSSGRRSGVLALARAEGRRVVRHPIFVAGALGSIAVFLVGTKDQAPVLQRDDILVVGALLPLAAATFLAANLAAMRERRHGTVELYRSTVTPEVDRTLGHLLSVLWAASVALVMTVAAIVYLVALHAVGSPSFLELMTGPAIVATSGALGILLARWWPHVAAGPIILVGLSALEVWLTVTLSGGHVVLTRVRWLGLWVPLSNIGDPPRELVIRPTGWHLWYLIGITALAGSLALLRSGPRPRPLSVAALALVLMITAGILQTRPPSDERLQALATLAEHPERFEACRSVAGVRYCAYPSYRGWIDRWSSVVTPVVDQVPPSLRPPGLEVQQAFIGSFGGDVADAAVSRVGTDAQGNRIFVNATRAIDVAAQWPRGVREAGYEFDLALGMASWLAGLPFTSEGIRLTRTDVRAILAETAPEDRAAQRKNTYVGAPWSSCDATGQARAVVALWLAGQATFRTAAWLRQQAGRSIFPPWLRGRDVLSDPDVAPILGSEARSLGVAGELAYIIGTPWNASRAEGDLAVQLLDRPQADITQTLQANWARLVDPRTPIDELIRTFGLRTPPSLTERLAKAGLDDKGIQRVLATIDTTSYQVPCR